MKIRNCVFLLAIFASFLLIIGIPMKGTQTISIEENRSLAQFPSVSISAFAHGNFQDDLEKAVNDQLLLSVEMKQSYFTWNQFLLDTTMNAILPKGYCVNRYTSIGDYFYNFDCNDQIVYGTGYTSDETLDQAQANIDYIRNSIPQVHTQFFYIPIDATLDFASTITTYPEYEHIFTNVPKEDVSYLNVKSYEDYQAYFYKSDHHANKDGSYEIYKGILRNLKPNESPLSVEQSVCFENLPFFGSKARTLADYRVEEAFCVNTFSYPKFTTYINGVVGSYGYEEKYLAQDTDIAVRDNHYGSYYGGDFGEVRFVNEQQEGNLMILSNSYSNSINKLLASHYENTYVIDLRHYEREMGAPFDLASYTQRHEINDVIYLGDLSVFTSDEFQLQKEEAHDIQ